MTKTLPISKVRENLPSIVADAVKKWDEYEITVNGSPAAVLLSKAQYDSWKETNEILADPQLMKSIREGEEDLRQGRFRDWEDVKKELGINVQSKAHRKSTKRAKSHPRSL